MTSYPGRLRYAALLAFAVATVTTCLALSRSYSGHFVTPPLFLPVRVLFFLQQGMFVGLLIAGVAATTGRLTAPALRTTLCLVPVTWAIWLAIWGLVHAAFGIRLSPAYTWEILSRRGAIAAAGLRPGRLYAVVALLCAGAAAFAYALQRAAVSSGPRFTQRAVLVLAALFLPIHLTVRAYMVHYVTSGQRAVLALDEATPLGLRTEYLLPGIRHRRLFIPNLEDRSRTAEYLAWADTLDFSRLAIPRKSNFLWLVIESLRFDAITAEGMPFLFSHRDEFQIRRERDHWSGGNETKAGTFSMLTGLAGYHMPAFRQMKLRFPFLRLLAANAYRTRIAKGWHFDWGALRDYFPSSATMVEIGTASLWRSDRDMVDSFLADLGRGDASARRFDLLTFDAPHWPYQYPEGHDVFAPATPLSGPTAYALSPAETLGVHNRYRNSLHFVDAEIGRTLEGLRERHRLDSTIVVITGDHGEEFLERGQLAHASAMDDFQGRVPLWIRSPGGLLPVQDDGALSSNLDIVPTVLDLMAFPTDVLRTQGTSLLDSAPRPPMLMLAEQGPYYPTYHALVGPVYLSRWRDGREEFLFSGVDRRDGGPVSGQEWWREVLAGRSAAARAYEVLPDPREPPRPFRRR